MTSTVNLEPLKRRTLTAEICEILAGKIVRGDWDVGMRILPERDLTEQLGVRRSSIREALKALEVMGMVQSRPGGRTVRLRTVPLLLRATAMGHHEQFRACGPRID